MGNDSADWDRRVDIVRQTLTRLAVDIDAQSIGNLAVDIAAQSVGNIGVSFEANNIGNIPIEIAAQTLGQVGIDIEAQNLGDVDINFNNQAQGVSSQKEFAADNQNIITAATGATVGSGNITTNELHANNSGSLQIIESIQFGEDDAFSNNMMIFVQVRDENDSVTIQFPSNPQNYPFNFDPGMPLVAGGDIQVQFKNNSGSQMNPNVAAILRQT